jgi:hypothetical protein
MTSVTHVKTRIIFSFVTKQALQVLRSIIGSAVGVGIAKKRPTKNNTYVACSIGTVIALLELPDDQPTICRNFIEMKYTVDDTMLTVSTAFSRITCTSAVDISTRTNGLGQLESSLATISWHCLSTTA